MYTSSDFNSPKSTAFNSHLISLKFFVFLSTLRALISAKYIMLTKNFGKLKLPPINERADLSSAVLATLICRVKKWVHLFSAGSRHSCYYRSYVLAVVLRQRGIPVSLNVGLRNLRSQAKNRGHCWVTLKGKPIFEFDDGIRLYPYLLKQNPYGINFWAGSNDEHLIKRHKINSPH